MCYLRYVCIWIRKHALLVISTVFPKRKNSRFWCSHLHYTLGNGTRLSRCYCRPLIGSDTWHVKQRLFGWPSRSFIYCKLCQRWYFPTVGQRLTEFKLTQEIRSVEHGICPIAEFTSPWLNCADSNRIPYPLFCISADVLMYMYCLEILSEYWKVTRLFKPLPRYRNF